MLKKQCIFDFIYCRQLNPLERQKNPTYRFHQIKSISGEYTLVIKQNSGNDFKSVLHWLSKSSTVIKKSDNTKLVQIYQIGLEQVKWHLAWFRHMETTKLPSKYYPNHSSSSGLEIYSHVQILDAENFMFVYEPNFWTHIEKQQQKVWNEVKGQLLDTHRETTTKSLKWG